MKKKRDFFWLSYSDLMTSLFFVMLVLFVLVYNIQNKLIGDLSAEKDELERIIQIDKQFDPLIKSGKFIYFPITKKFVAKDLIGNEIFEPNKTIILPKYVQATIDVGNEIERLLKKLSEENQDFAYQLVIEGNMANFYDKRIDINNNDGYEMSYKRALAVYQLWRNYGINLRKFNTEILICGSGFNGLDRDKKEENNKRFSIQIIPKISSRLKKIQ